MGVAIFDSPICEVCRVNEAVVCCDDALFRCADCCSEDGFDSGSGEVYEYDYDWSSDEEDT